MMIKWNLKRRYLSDEPIPEDGAVLDVGLACEQMKLKQYSLGFYMTGYGMWFYDIEIYLKLLEHG